MKVRAALVAACLGLLGCVADTTKITSIELHNKEKVGIPAQVYRVSKGKNDVLGKTPTVIFLHGCGGINEAHTQDWVRKLNDWGYNAVVLDSLSSRGFSQICDNTLLRVSPEQRSVDAHNASKWIREQDWATDKVGLIGFSHGGSTVLYNVASGYAGRNYGQQIIAAAVAFYPGCDPSLLYDKPALPLQVHIGDADDWTPPRFCRELLGERYWNLMEHYFEYPGQTHGFDMVGFNQLSLPDRFGKRHWLKYDARMTETSRQRTREFLDRHLK